MYITPVISTALIWRLDIPNKPSKAADPSKIMHTIEQDIDNLCIPENSIQQLGNNSIFV